MVYILILMGIGTLINEISAIYIKKTPLEKLSSYNKGFIIGFFGVIVNLFFGYLVGYQYEFNIISIIITLYLIFGFVSYRYFIIKATEEGERSIISFFGILGMPILLLFDLIMGYGITLYQIIGMSIIFGVITFVSLQDTKFKKDGIKWVLLSQIVSLLNVITFKYGLEEKLFNVPTIIMLFSFFGTFIFGIFTYRNGGFKNIKQIYQKDNILIGLLNGISTLFTQYCYLYGGASLVSVTKRIYGIFWGYFSGKYFFKEEKTSEKFLLLGLLILGIIFMFI